MWRIAATSLLVLAGCDDSNTVLIPEDAIDGDRIHTALTEQPGNSARGAEIFAARDLGHCVLCHRVDGLEVPFQGDVGPALTGVGARLDTAQLRLRLVDYEELVSGSVMPSYFRVHDLHQVAEEYSDQPILSAQQIEDLVAYLSSLGGPDAP